MKDQEIDINLVLAALRELIGTQAQEIAVLRATVAAMTPQETES